MLYGADGICSQIVNLIDAAGLADADEQDIEELRQSFGRKLTNDALQKLTEEGIYVEL